MWTCSPSRTSAVVDPMGTPYLITFDPNGRSQPASLWPSVREFDTFTVWPAIISSVPAETEATSVSTLSRGSKSSKRGSVRASYFGKSGVTLRQV